MYNHQFKSCRRIPLAVATVDAMKTDTLLRKKVEFSTARNLFTKALRENAPKDVVMYLRDAFYRAQFSLPVEYVLVLHTFYMDKNEDVVGISVPDDMSELNTAAAVIDGKLEVLYDVLDKVGYEDRTEIGETIVGLERDRFHIREGYLLKATFLDQ